MTNTYFAIKKQTTQVWDKSGNRLPITIVEVPELVVTQVKNTDKDGYSAIQVAMGESSKHNLKKPLAAHLKKASLDKSPRYIREIEPSLDEGETLPELGQALNQVELMSIGDVVNVAGTTKGAGFTGVVKRWGFAGGPKTHGQSDRMRAPGSIGQGTTPGRVHKGKKMAGRHGGFRRTSENLLIVNIDKDSRIVWIKGTVAGPRGGLLTINKIGSQDFVGVVSDTPVEAPADTTNTQETVTE